MADVPDELPPTFGTGLRRGPELRRLAWAILPPLLAAILLFGVTELPYAAGRRAAPPGYRFDGLIAHSRDIHAYFSFVLQGAEGRWLSENRFTPASHVPAFFNLEWLLVGRAMRYLGDPGVFVAWRAVGLLLLVSGFWALAAHLRTRVDRLLALALFCLGGGFGWLVQLGRAVGVAGGVLEGEVGSFLDADQRWGVQPFVQMLQNPHFAVTHGLALFALALLVKAERTERARTYAAAGLVALLACLSRPYDLIAFAVAVPLLHLFSGAVSDARRGVRRALTLVMLLPCAFPLWVLWRNPHFHPWAKQGVMPVVPLVTYGVLLGVPAVVVAARLVCGKRLSFGDPAERVMWIWGGAVLLLSQANRFTTLLPWSPQILITSMGPIVMLAVPALTGTTGEGPRRPMRTWLVAVALVFALPSSAITEYRRWQDTSVYSHRWRETGVYSPLYVSDGERSAWEWLAGKVQSSDVILATAPSSLRLPRHVPAHVVAGHWTLSPEYDRRSAEALAFFQGRLTSQEAAEYMGRLGVDWVWDGPWERALGEGSTAGFPPNCVLAYERLGVSIYRCGD